MNPRKQFADALAIVDAAEDHTPGNTVRVTRRCESMSNMDSTRFYRRITEKPLEVAFGAIVRFDVGITHTAKMTIGEFTVITEVPTEPILRVDSVIG